MVTGARKRGMALPLALFALILIGGLMAVGFAVAQLEQRVGRNTLYAVQAGAAAEIGALSVVADWDGHGLAALAPGEGRTLPSVELPGRTSYEATVRRLNDALFAIAVVGTRHDAEGGILAQRDVRLTLRRADRAVAGALPVVPLANRAWTAASP